MENKTTHKPKYFQHIIGAVLIVIGVILIASAFKNEEVAILPDSQEVLDETTRVVEATNYEYSYTKDWEYLENAQEDIQDLTRGQTIGGRLVQDPIESNVVYFTGSIVDEEANEYFSALYKYNEDDYSFERLWKQTYEEMGTFDGTEIEQPSLWLLGYENEQLIFFIHDGRERLSPCAEPWLISEESENRTLYSLDLNDPYGGFTSYTPPQEVIETYQNLAEECEDSL